MATKFRNFVSPHVHIQSLDSASTPQEFAEKEVELGTGAITVTDHGTLVAVPEVYEMAKKHKLTPILGEEIYLRDDDCPILTAAGMKKDEQGTFANVRKYYHACIHCCDEAAYLTLAKETSLAFDRRGEKHGSEVKPLMTWEQIERIGSMNTTGTSGCLIGVVQGHLMNGNKELATAYYEKMRSCFKPGAFYVEVFPHVCDRYWDQGVYLKFPDGEQKYRAEKKLSVRVNEKEIEVTAMELHKRMKLFQEHGKVQLLAVKHYYTWYPFEAPKDLVDTEYREGFYINDCTEWSPDGDLQKPANQFVIEMAKKYGDKILIGDDSHFAVPEHHEFQTSKLLSGGGNWRFHTSYHRQNSAAAFEHFKNTLGISEREFEEWIDNSYEFRDRFKDFKFNPKVRMVTKRYPEDTLGHLRELILAKGRMRFDDQRYIDRLQSEIRMLHENGTIDLLPYFFFSQEVVQQYIPARKSTGPGRGSAAGILIAYLLGITHMDPIRYELSQDRFITTERILSGKLPDIDMDLPDRDLLLDPANGWLFKTFGECAAAIATKTSLRLKSSIKDVFRVKYGRVPDYIEALCRKLPNPPQGVDDEDWVFGYTAEDGKEMKGLIEESQELKSMAETHPDEWRKVCGLLSLARNYSRHASAFVVADEPISNFLPTQQISGYRTTQYTMKGVEAHGGLKFDFLGLATLNHIQTCIDILQQDAFGGPLLEDQIINGELVPSHMVVPHKGQLYFTWDLPNDQNVFRKMCEQDTETVFQLNTASARKWLKEFNHWKDEVEGKKSICSVVDVANFTALDRPGPLDAYVMGEDGKKHNMLQEYARRARGLPPIGEIPALTKILPDEYGVLVTQEGLQKVYQELTGCTGSEANEFRTFAAKKQRSKMEATYPGFMERASAKIGAEQARQIWDAMITFAAYGFCKAHATCYAAIAYTCAFLKYHYPLQWWTAVLTHTDKDKILEKLWPHCQSMVLPPSVSRSKATFSVEGDKIRAPLSFLGGVGPKAHQELVAGAPYKDIDDFAKRIYAVRATPVVAEDGTTKNGRSAVNRGVVYKLILSGALNDLFPHDIQKDDLAKFYAYETAMCENAPRKQLKKGGLSKIKTAKVDPKWINMTSLQRYLSRVSIFPTSPESSLGVLSDHNFEGLRFDGQFYQFSPSDNMTILKGLAEQGVEITNLYAVEGQQLQNFWTMEVPPDSNILCCAFVYVTAERRFRYHEQQRQALAVTFTSLGLAFESVKWPDRKTGILKAPSANLTETLCFVMFSRYKTEKAPVIEAIIPIAKLETEEKDDEE